VKKYAAEGCCRLLARAGRWSTRESSLKAVVGTPDFADMVV
jgi:hypothetical protein